MNDENIIAKHSQSANGTLFYKVLSYIILLPFMILLLLVLIDKAKSEEFDQLAIGSVMVLIVGALFFVSTKVKIFFEFYDHFQLGEKTIKKNDLIRYHWIPFTGFGTVTYIEDRMQKRGFYVRNASREFKKILEPLIGDGK